MLTIIKVGMNFIHYASDVKRACLRGAAIMLTVAQVMLHTSQGLFLHFLRFTLFSLRSFYGELFYLRINPYLFIYIK